MPRLAVISDIHGNWPAFQAVLADLQRHTPIDRLLVSGDITSGPGQEQILRRLDDLNAVMIQGNGEHDLAAMLNGCAPGYYFTSRQYSMARWALEHLSSRAQKILRALPEQAVYQHPGADPIRLVHGSPRRCDRQIWPDRPGQLESAFEGVPEPVLVCGHSHRPWQARLDGKMALNPGAVNFPQTGFRGAQYAILDWHSGSSGRRGRWVARHYQVTYDLDALRHAYIESGFLVCSPLARVILQSVLTGQDAIPPYFSRLHRLATEAGCTGMDHYPDEIWERAAAEFPWLDLDQR